MSVTQFYQLLKEEVPMEQVKQLMKDADQVRMKSDQLYQKLKGCENVSLETVKQIIEDGARTQKFSKELYELLSGEEKVSLEKVSLEKVSLEKVSLEKVSLTKVSLEQVKQLIENGANPNELGPFLSLSALDLCAKSYGTVSQDILDYLFEIGCTYHTEEGGQLYQKLSNASFQQVKDHYKATVDAAKVPDDKIMQRIRESFGEPSSFQRNREHLIKEVETLLDHLRNMKDSPSGFDWFTRFDRTMEYIQDSNTFLPSVPRIDNTNVWSVFQDRKLDMNCTNTLENAILQNRFDHVEKILRNTKCKVGLHHLYLVCKPRNHYYSQESEEFLSMFQLLVDHFDKANTYESFKGPTLETYLHSFRYFKALEIWRKKAQ